MRIIKFRAWDTIDNSMIPNEEMFTEWFEDDSLILMQFTGLTDKNGKDIYEGDIVKCVFSEPVKEAVIYKVIFDVKEAMFKLINSKGTCMLTHRIIKLEIIGNIYENPNLIGQIKKD